MGAVGGREEATSRSDRAGLMLLVVLLPSTHPLRRQKDTHERLILYPQEYKTPISCHNQTSFIHTHPESSSGADIRSSTERDRKCWAYQRSPTERDQKWGRPVKFTLHLRNSPETKYWRSSCLPEESSPAAKANHQGELLKKRRRHTSTSPYRQALHRTSTESCHRTQHRNQELQPENYPLQTICCIAPTPNLIFSFMLIRRYSL